MLNTKPNAETNTALKNTVQNEIKQINRQKYQIFKMTWPVQLMTDSKDGQKNNYAHTTHDYYIIFNL